MPLVVLLLTVWTFQSAWAFPGQTADDMIRVLGPSANQYMAPPVPDMEAVRAGTAQLSKIYWPQARYDPLRSGAAFAGILVATFDYRHPTLLTRVQQTPPDIGWKDLVSHSEVFMAFLPPAAFQQFMTAITKTWEVTSKVRQGSGTGYDLYTLTSKDRRLTAEVSYTDKGEVPPPPDPVGQKPPTLNFWSRITSVQ